MATGGDTRAVAAVMSPVAARTAVIAGAFLGLLLSGGLVWSANSAAFIGTTRNPSNNWAAAAVSVSDDDSENAMFNLSGIIPGDRGEKCILVTYTGNVSSAVRLRASTPTGTLAPYLTITVEQGTGGSFASCTGFAPSVSSGNITLANFATNHSSHANGFGNWNPTGNGQTRTYRMTWSIAADNAAANKTAGATFTWEALNA